MVVLTHEAVNERFKALFFGWKKGYVMSDDDMQTYIDTTPVSSTLPDFINGKRFGGVCVSCPSCSTVLEDKVVRGLVSQDGDNVMISSLSLCHTCRTISKTHLKIDAESVVYSRDDDKWVEYR